MPRGISAPAPGSPGWASEFVEGVRRVKQHIGLIVRRRHVEPAGDVVHDVLPGEVAVQPLLHGFRGLADDAPAGGGIARVAAEGQGVQRGGGSPSDGGGRPVTRRYLLDTGPAFDFLFMVAAIPLEPILGTLPKARSALSNSVFIPYHYRHEHSCRACR